MNLINKLSITVSGSLCFCWFFVVVVVVCFVCFLGVRVGGVFFLLLFLFLPVSIISSKAMHSFLPAFDQQN